MKQDEKQLMELQTIQLVPYGTYSETRTLSGLILPGGVKVLSVKEVSGKLFGIYRRQLNATVFNVTGSWTFTPDDETIREFGNG